MKTLTELKKYVVRTSGVNISEKSAKAEGCKPFELLNFAAKNRCRASYHELWEILNRDRGFGWDVNPWVWVLKFRRVK